MTQNREIALAAFVLAVGLAGRPFDPLHIIGAAVLCGALVFSRKFIAAAAFLAVILAGWLQHGEFRITVLVAAAALGLAVRFAGATARGRTVIAILSVATGLAMAMLAAR